MASSLVLCMDQACSAHGEQGLQAQLTLGLPNNRGVNVRLPELTATEKAPTAAEEAAFAAEVAPAAKASALAFEAASPARTTADTVLTLLVAPAYKAGT